MTASKGIGRGGRREGAGRKSEDGVLSFATVTANVDERSYNLIMLYGEGNASLGVRHICALVSSPPAKIVKKHAVIKRGSVYDEPTAATKVKPAPPVLREVNHYHKDGTRKYSRYSSAEWDAEEEVESHNAAATAEYEKKMAAYLGR
jgi:hypothetical protein